jgi:hypothetical protein
VGAAVTGFESAFVEGTEVTERPLRLGVFGYALATRRAGVVGGRERFMRDDARLARS